MCKERARVVLEGNGLDGFDCEQRIRLHCDTMCGSPYIVTHDSRSPNAEPSDI